MLSDSIAPALQRIIALCFIRGYWIEVIIPVTKLSIEKKFGLENKRSFGLKMSDVRED